MPDKEQVAVFLKGNISEDSSSDGESDFGVVGEVVWSGEQIAVSIENHIFSFDVSDRDSLDGGVFRGETTDEHEAELRVSDGDVWDDDFVISFWGDI